MNETEVGKYWDANADNWTKLARLGYDVWRDYVNMPAFLEMLPDVSGMVGVDVGCGEGANTREFAKRSAEIYAFDISRNFICHAVAESARQQLPIHHSLASAVQMPFIDRTFDFATATMRIMDMPDHANAFAEIHRVLKPGGFLQFSVVHPMFNSMKSGWELNNEGKKNDFIVRGYFDINHGEVEEWNFSAAPEEMNRNMPPFRVPRFDRTVSGWLNLVIESGFKIERVEEPRPSLEVRHHFDKYTDSGIIPFSFVVRCRKQ